MCLQNFKTAFTSFEEIQENIELLECVEERYVIQEAYTDALTEAEIIGASLNSNALPVSIENSATTNSSAALSSSDQNLNNERCTRDRMKLSKTFLPRFTGNYEDWREPSV